MTFGRSLLLAAALALGAVSSAQALTTNWATSVVDWQPGTGANPNTQLSRDNPLNALGAPNGSFFSLGLGGIAWFTFGGPFDSSATLVEITNTTRSTYVENVEVYVGTSYTVGSFSLNGFTLVSTIANDTGSKTIALPAGVWSFLALVDVSPFVAGRDGWDVDAIGVRPVPVPAGVLLLASALGGFAVFRRRAATV